MGVRLIHYPKKAYIAGPMSGFEDFNRPLFDRCEAWLESQEVKPVSPAHLNRMLGDDATYERFLRAGIKFLVDCDWIIMLPGWEKSKGACLELEIADACGIEVFEFVCDDDPDGPHLRGLTRHVGGDA